MTKTDDKKPPQERDREAQEAAQNRAPGDGQSTEHAPGGVGDSFQS